MGVNIIFKFFAFIALALFASYSSYIDTLNRINPSFLIDSGVSGPDKLVIEKSMNSSVRVISSVGDPNIFGTTATSSGTYLSHLGFDYIITSAHSLIGDCEETFVIVDDYMFHCLDFIIVDHSKDYAIFEVEQVFNRNPIKIIDILHDEKATLLSTNVHEKTIYTGYPQGIGPFTFDGKIVSHKQQNGVIYVHSYAWAGSSGSGVFNSNGMMIGIITAVSVANSDLGVDVMEDLIIVTSLSLVDFRDVL